MLTKEEILYILNRIGRKVVVQETKEFPFEITAKSSGYHDDEHISRLQAKLSIMLEVASNRPS